MSVGRPATGAGSSSTSWAPEPWRRRLRTMRSFPLRSVTRIAKLPAPRDVEDSGTNAMLHGCVSPLRIVILIGRTRPVSIDSGPSGSGGDGQLIGGGEVACPRPPAAGGVACCADMTAAVSIAPHTPRIALRMTHSPVQVIPHVLVTLQRGGRAE